MECNKRHTWPIFAAVWTSLSTLKSTEQLCLKKTHSSRPQQHWSSAGFAAIAPMAPMTSRGRAPASWSGLVGVSAIPSAEEGEIGRRLGLRRRMAA